MRRSSPTSLSAFALASDPRRPPKWRQALCIGRPLLLVEPPFFAWRSGSFPRPATVASASCQPAFSLGKLPFFTICHGRSGKLPLFSPSPATKDVDQCKDRRYQPQAARQDRRADRHNSADLGRAGRPASCGAFGSVFPGLASGSVPTGHISGAVLPCRAFVLCLALAAVSQRVDGFVLRQGSFGGCAARYGF